jgi:hypothetical protein
MLRIKWIFVYALFSGLLTGFIFFFCVPKTQPGIIIVKHKNASFIFTLSESSLLGLKYTSHKHSIGSYRASTFMMRTENCFFARASLVLTMFGGRC